MLNESLLEVLGQFFAPVEHPQDQPQHVNVIFATKQCLSRQELNKNTPDGPNNQTTTSIIVGMPTLGEPDYCNKLQTYITTRGGGNATPDQIMAAHDMFKMNCREADPTTTTTTLAPPPPPPPSKPDVVIPVIPVANLGVPPLSMGGGGGGGGSEDGAPAPKKKNYWWLLLVAAGIYLVAKKKN